MANTAGFFAILIAAVASFTGCGASRPGDKCIHVDANGISFPGVIYPSRYNNHPDRALGHHFIVWSSGGAASKALIETPCPDREILEALMAIGVTPGENLSPETWTQRHNPASPAPDQQVEGTRIQITVEWNGCELPAEALFEDIHEDQIDIRVGGHASLIPIWRSGCVTCLFSCPGGRTSNASYSIRDQAQNRITFRAATERLPADGASVRVWMRKHPEM